ncbi:DUF4357 domain-containing protein [Paeniclostridium sordellii]|uniref:GIY-YIG nuclease family protein n=1 Tax=Paraclostridium sordellii TaxID=1505 RepID=UPI0005DE42C4|nr:GIY-YIG nuclease family protein [Paeniclostridium sordellii]MDU4412812.1 GIY-YIG nuclease family protein [Paeniclostridium sordellii]MRZ29587.1 DUF4357 domain-containing protein [Paeniclostridium sordellii]MVO73647.1 DUF4357 domain-containing protein [Paeniclostridium sordellii]CEQ06456.1 Uncharacterised protein [[Clostridium] sordellii] [Paeniclostridium sordellii]
MGKTINTYLINENQYGPKTIEIKNWVGKAMYSPVNNLAQLLKTREEFDKPGIYFLKSQSDKDIYTEKIYVGEGECVKDRLASHLVDENRDFDECIVFISKDDMLTKAHIRYIEAKAIKEIKKLNNSELENKNEQKFPKLSESDISDVEYFFEEMKIIMPLASFNCFKSNITNISKNEHEKEETKKRISEYTFYIDRNGIKATAIENEEGFIVLKGSSCKKQSNKSMKKDRKVLKKKLIESGILIEKEDVYIFKEDTIFKSSSQASSIILGSQTSGPQSWKTKDNKTYKKFVEYNLNMDK